MSSGTNDGPIDRRRMAEAGHGMAFSWGKAIVHAS